MGLLNRESPIQGSQSGSEEEFEAAALAMILQAHGAARTYVTVLDTFGRLASLGLVVYFGTVGTFTAVQLVSGLVVAVLVAASWLWRRRLTLSGVESVEETLSRMAGSAVEGAYIESRFISEARSPWAFGLLPAEPTIWFAASLLVIVLDVIVNGIAS